MVLRRVLTAWVAIAAAVTRTHAPDATNAQHEGCRSQTSTSRLGSAPPLEAVSAWDAGHSSGPACGLASQQHLSDDLMQGMHVLQLLPQQASSNVSNGAARCAVTVHVDGVASSAPPTLELSSCQAPIAEVLPALKQAAAAERPLLYRRLRRAGTLTQSTVLELREFRGARRHANEWRGFSPGGKPLSPHPGALVEALGNCGAVYVYEGGVFMWPGIRHGYERTLATRAGGNIMMTTLSLQPLVFSIANLLPIENAERLIALGEEHMRPMAKGLRPRRLAVCTGHAHPPALKGEKWDDHDENLLLVADQSIATIEDIAQDITRAPASHNEPLYILEYRAGDRFDAHLDAHGYHVKNTRMSNTVKPTRHKRYRDRLSTLLVYLRKPKDGGGETLFPRAGGRPLTESDECPECTANSTGLRVVPQQGSAIFWYNIRADGAQDRFSLHSSCATGAGGNNSKWSANLWTWNEPY